MGNLEAESGLKSVIYQNSYKGSVGLTDQQYVDQVNSGAYSEYKFVHDSVGFGLEQWTYYSRKQELYNKCKKGRGDIGNLNCQVDFLLDELKGTKLSNYLKTVTDVYAPPTDWRRCSRSILATATFPSSSSKLTR